MANVVLCREIREVKGGYIVEARFPYGDVSPFGEVFCKDIGEVADLLRQCSPRASEKAPAAQGGGER